eukprot:TRINITY_DN10863_c0_g1_i3.p1 TRINITY_DN10863_c0_g1~~TRINITY_DN10863_c0_g1_i3.p1  ORF type:complete len:111 (+),score=19.06 TRINITY_DN10863_c0_g1_i3:97-429(+)
MIRRPPRSTQGVSSAASDVYKRQVHGGQTIFKHFLVDDSEKARIGMKMMNYAHIFCLLSLVLAPGSRILLQQVSKWGFVKKLQWKLFNKYVPQNAIQNLLPISKNYTKQK